MNIIPNGVDYEYFSTIKIPELSKIPRWNKYPLLIFTGIMDYFANEDGVCWFCNMIFSLIRNEFPNAKFLIVGDRPSDIVWSLSEIDGITVTGYVEDIREYYWMADICVIPLRIARGLQNKVIEAMSIGNAVVATSNASNGINCTNQLDIVIADQPEAFAKDVINLLHDHDRRKSIKENAVRTIHEKYSWERNLKDFDRLMEAIECAD